VHNLSTYVSQVHLHNHYKTTHHERTRVQIPAGPPGLCFCFKEFVKIIEKRQPLITSVVNGIDNGLQALERSLKGDEVKVVVRI
jgi:hypothetical protein